MILEKTYQIAHTARLPAVGIYRLAMRKINCILVSFSCFNYLNEGMTMGSHIDSVDLRLDAVKYSK
jgi:hypothetical protein